MPEISLISEQSWIVMQGAITTEWAACSHGVNGDGRFLWERANFDPPPNETWNTWTNQQKIGKIHYVADICPCAKFAENRSSTKADAKVELSIAAINLYIEILLLCAKCRSQTNGRVSGHMTSTQATVIVVGRHFLIRAQESVCG